MKRNSVIKLICALALCFALLLSLGAQAVADGEIKVVDSAYLDGWIKDYCAQYGLNDFSVGFCYTATGEYWFYNADEFMYSASMYKVPVSMLLSEKEAAGEITQESEIYPGLSVQYLEYTAIVNSNNDSGHYIADYVGKGVSKYDTYNGKCADLAQKYAPTLSNDYFPEDYYEWSYYSARYITEAIKTLYDGGEEKFPNIIGYMKQAQMQNYFHLKQENGYEIAQKYGDYQEKSGDTVHHCTGIIYTPTPIIVTVMSKNISYYEQRIAEVAKFLTDYSLELDEKLLTATPAPVPTEEPAEETPEPAPSAAPTAAPATPAPDETEEGPKAPLPPLFYILLITAVVSAVIIAVVVKSGKKNNKKTGYKPKH